MKIRTVLTTAALLALVSPNVFAQVREAVTSAAFVFNGQELQITQSDSNDPAAVARHFQRADDCRSVCLAPMMALANVNTVGERDVIDFVQTQVAVGAGLLLDSRTPEQRAAGYIATSVNVPLALLEPGNPFLTDILMAMGATRNGATLDFSSALPLIVFDDGPASFEAPQLIAALIENGYPADRIQYYRGGMLVWSALGLSAEDT